MRRWETIDKEMKQLWESSVRHTKTVTELAREGENALLQNAPLLQTAEAELHMQRQQVQKAVHDTTDDLQRLKDTFTMLPNAEKQMPRLREADKQTVTGGLDMLHKVSS